MSNRPMAKQAGGRSVFRIRMTTSLVKPLSILSGEGRPGRPVPPGRAFEEILADHLDPLYRAALRLCRGRPADAEDLLQEAAMKGFQAFGQLRSESAARGWLFTILTRTHLNRIRSIRRRSEELEADLDESAFEEALAGWRPLPQPDEALRRTLLGERVQAAVDDLDVSLREVVWLVDAEGFSHREVAAMLRIPEGTVASRLFRARRALRERLSDMKEWSYR